MGYENFSQKPREVKDAISGDKREVLSAMGRKGARAATNNRIYADHLKGQYIADAAAHEERLLKDVPEEDR